MITDLLASIFLITGCIGVFLFLKSEESVYAFHPGLFRVHQSVAMLMFFVMGWLVVALWIVSYIQDCKKSKAGRD